MSRKKYISILASLLSLVPNLLMSQTLEYWFDDQYDLHNTTSITVTDEEQELSLDLRDNSKFPNGFHNLYMRLIIAGKPSAVYSSPVLKLSAGTATALEYWIDDDIANARTFEGHLASDGKDYIFVSDLDLGDITPGYHRLYCRAVSSSKHTVSAVTMTPIMVKSRYYNNPMVTYNDPKMIQYTIGVDEKGPVTYPIQNVAKEVEITHTFDASDLTNGKHLIKMDFWNSSLKNVTDTFSFVAKTTGNKLATPKPSTFKATNITASGFTASWDEIEGALYYDILVKHDGGDYEHPDFKGGSSGTSIEVTGLNPSTSYYFQIRARNDNRNEASDWSASIPNAIKTMREPTAIADLAIHSIEGFDGSVPLTKGRSYHYKVWIVNNENSVWNGSFFLKDGNDDIKGWYTISIPKTSAQLLECDYVPESAGTKELILYYQTNGKGSGIPVNMSDNTPNKMVVQIGDETTYNEGLKLAKAITCPTTSQLGNAVNLSATIINKGNNKWSGTLYLVDNGITLTDEKVTLKSGNSKTLTASWTPETAGLHDIAVYYMTEKGYSWQLVSENGYKNPICVEVSRGDALNNATYANISHVTKDVVPSEVTVGSVVYYYFRLTDDDGNRLKGIRIRFECTGSGLRDIVETAPSDENGIAVLEIKTEGSAAIAARGETVKMVCKALLNENNDNVLFAYQPSDGEIELTIHQGTTASMESGFENIEKMKFTLDLGLSAKAGLGNYVKAKGSVAFPLSLSMKFDNDGEFKDFSYDAKIKGSLSGSVGNFDDEYYSQNFGTSSTVIQGSAGVSGGWHYNYSVSDWRDIFVRFIMKWCDTYYKVNDWKKDVAIKTLESWYETKRDWKETTNWFIGGEIGASVDFLNVVEIPSFVQRSNKLPLMSFPDLGLGGNVSFSLDCNIKKEDKNQTLIGDGVSYKMKGEFKAQEKVQNLFNDAKLWWYTSVKHKFLNQLNNFYLNTPTQNVSCAFSVKSEELFDNVSGNLKEISHEMSLENRWDLSFNNLQIPWNPIDANEAKIGVTSTSTSKFVSKEDWATYVGEIAKSSPGSQDAKYVYSLYPNLKFTTLFTTPGEIFSFWMRPPEGALNKLMSKASDPTKFKLKDALKIEHTLSSDLTMAVNIPIFDWKLLKFSIDVGATLGLYNKPTVSYYSVEDKSFFPLSVHPTTSIYSITGWLLHELAEKLASIFDNDKNDIVNYIPMDDAYGTGSVSGINTLLIVPGLPQYDEAIDPSYPYFLDYNEQDNDGNAKGGTGGDDGCSFMPHLNSSKSQGVTHYKLDNFNNSYAKYVIRKHPRLGERIQRDICNFTFNFNDGTQNFDEGVIIKIPHYYPAGDLFAITEEGDTLFVVSEVCNVIAQDGDSILKKTQQGDFEITGKVGVDDLIPFGFPENQSLDVYYCAENSEIWQYVGPAGTPLKVNKLGAYMMATSVKNDLEAPKIAATLNEKTGLIHINVTDNIGVKVSSLQVFVNGEQKQVEMINESSYELQLTQEEMQDKIELYIAVCDLADNEGNLSQMFNLNPHLLLGDVNGDKDINVNDVMMIVSHILGTTPSNFIKRNADMDRNESIDVKDLMQVVYIILYNEYPHAPADARHDTGDNILLAANNNGCSICLDGNGSFNACEMTLSLPEGCILQDASLDNRQPGSHQVMVNKLNDGRYRLVVFAPSDRKTILSEGAMVNLALSGRADGIKVSDIIFCNSQYETFVFSDVMGITTGMDGISASDYKGDTYSIQGIKTTTPKKGVYIKDRKKKAVK